MQKREFTQIYNEYAIRLYNFILWTTQNRGACDDILQNVFIKIWNAPSVPDGDIERQRWLFAVTRNACYDFFRKHNRFSRFRQNYSQEFVMPAPDPDARFVWDEVSELPEIERTILYLHLKIGYTYKEISPMVDLAENLVRVKAFRALKKLRKTLIEKES